MMRKLLAIVPVLEAVAITAGVKLHWPELDMAVAKPTIVDRHNIMVIVPERIARDRFEAASMVAFCEERIDLEKCWTGTHYAWIGYGPRTNTLVVSYH